VRERWRAEVAAPSAIDLVFLDEIGSHLGYMPTHAWSPYFNLIEYVFSKVTHHTDARPHGPTTLSERPPEPPSTPSPQRTPPAGSPTAALHRNHQLL
jgi:hypothetical protein